MLKEKSLDVIRLFKCSTSERFNYFHRNTNCGHVFQEDKFLTLCACSDSFSVEIFAGCVSLWQEAGDKRLCDERLCDKRLLCERLAT